MNISRSCSYSCINYCLMICMNLFSFKENLALKKPTYQQYMFPGYDASLYEASNAVDGLKSDLSFHGGQCVCSAGGQRTATWWVNLTSILSIHHVTIYYMTNNNTWGMQLLLIMYTKWFQSSTFCYWRIKT